MPIDFFTGNPNGVCMKHILSMLIAGFSLFWAACASKLVVQSEPSQAEVSAQVEGKQERVKLGLTPLEITETELAQKLMLTPVSTQWIKLNLDKKEFSSREVFLPSNRWGETLKIIKLKLESNPDKATVVQEMLSHFFNAKKFAETRQYAQAHSEIDKVLALDSKSVKAINMKAGIHYLEGRLDEAKKLYLDALNLDPNSSDSIKMLEKIQNKRGGAP